MGKQWEGCTGGRTAKACPLDPETHWEVTAYLEGSAQKSLREGHAWGGGVPCWCHSANLPQLATLTAQELSPSLRLNTRRGTHTR